VRGPYGDRASAGAEVKDMLTRLQITTPNNMLDHGSEARVNLTKIEFRDPVPHSLLPL